MNTNTKLWHGVVVRYACAIIAVAAAIMLRWLLLRVGPVRPLFVTFYPAVLIIATTAGLGPGILTTVLSALVSDYWFIRPYGSFRIADRSDALALAIFTGTCLAVCVVTEGLRRARWAAAYRLAKQQEAEVRILEIMRARETQSRLATIVDSSDDAILSVNFDGAIQTWNAGAERLFGYAAQEVIGRPITLLIPADRLAEEQEILQRLRAGTHVDHLETVRVAKDGRRIDVSVTASPLKDPAGQVVGVSKITRDISDRKRAEQALTKQREELELILDSTPAWIFYKDRENRFLRVNHAFAKVMGLPKEQMKGRSVFDLYPRWQAEAFFKDDQEVMASGQPRLNIVEPAQSAAGERWVQTDKVPCRDAAGNIIGIIGFAVDITERKRAEQALKRANAELEQRVQERTAELVQRAAQLRALAGELTLTEQRERQRLAKILHDHLQQLLVSANFRLGILGRNDDEAVRKKVHEVEKLIDDCIVASRSLSVELSPPILHEAGLNDGLAWLARWMADKHGLSVELSTEPEPVPVAEDVRVLLFESVRELLLNAVKHAHTRSATVDVRRVDSYVRVAVSDQGVGFDPRVISQAGTQGGGLGLFSIRERVELIGGRLEIDSAPGKGSRFVLAVPLEKAAAISLTSHATG